MDRQIVYPGSIPLDTDLLNIQRNSMLAVGALAQCALGTSQVADGLVCTPMPSGVGVVVGPGSLTAFVASDATPFGSLAADPTMTVKAGINTGSTQLQLAMVGDQSYVLCWLIQASFQEIDAGAVALPYWNAANPTVPFSGPGNSGAAQNTRRVMRVALSTKRSDPVPLGSFVPPPPDPGWVGLYGVTTWSGRSGVSADDIRPLADAPFLPFRLPQLTPGFSRQETLSNNVTWQVPAGVRRMRVRLVGGGGGGGGGQLDFGGGGGGGGGYAEGIYPVLPGAQYAVVVGAGGQAAPPGVSGGAGGPSLFGDLVAATGGLGGGSSNPDSHGGGGGGGVAGTLLQLGGLGGDGPMIGSVPAGNGGTSAFGGGGRGAYLGGAPANGQAAGSGAGGGYGADAWGGVGASGIVIVEY